MAGGLGAGEGHTGAGHASAARCAACGRANQPTASFCVQCGAALARLCAHCGHQLEPGGRFCPACGHAVEAEGAASRGGPALPRTFAAGRYQVQRLLGEGSKKRVFLAHDTRLDRDVAIAVFKTEGLDEAGRVRAQREARAMGRLGDHPNIVTVYDVGEEAGVTYIVTQYMARGALDHLLHDRAGHRLALDEALRIATQIAQGLAYAHERGIVHRDLKPANVWLTAEGVAKLGDFGLALAVDSTRLTLEGMMVGTVTHMPPEQALGRETDARSDLYALGVILYEMVTGRPPFVGDDTLSVISQHLNTVPVAPSWHNPEVPRALEALILRLLAKVPDERPADAIAVQEALAEISPSAERAPVAPAAGQGNRLDGLAGGGFVGREREMEELRTAVDDALSGKGRLVLLVGEPGIGKTRAAEEIATYARLRRAQVLVGRSYEGEGAPAFWPWVQIVRSHVHDVDAEVVQSEMGSGAGEIARIVSELRERLHISPPEPGLEPDQARFRLFESLTAFFKNAAKTQPLVLILDDLHWADKPSLLLLQFLAREIRDTRLLLIGTYRDAGLTRQHPLSQALAELTREQLTHRISLRALSQRDVGRFIEITTGRAAPDVLVAAVHEQTEGNPLFVHEVVRLLATNGRLERPEAVTSWSVEIPQGVRDVIGRRLSQLSSECNHVLTVASVLGREFAFGALEQLSEVSGDQLLAALEEAIGARVINEVPGVVDRYVFSHALVRATLYEELSTVRRARLHLRAGEVLEQLYGANAEAHLAELAYQFSQAGERGNVDKAVEYGLKAAERATRSMGFEEAVRQYEVAVAAIERRTPPDPARLCQVLLLLGGACSDSGDPERAREVFQRAADTARAMNAPELLAHAALGFRGRLPGFGSGTFDKSLVDLLEEALAALGDSESAARTLVMARLAEATVFTAPTERRRALCERAIGDARRAGDRQLLAHVLISTHWALYGPDNLEERLGWASEVVTLAQSIGDQVAEAEGRFYRFGDLLEAGDSTGAEEEFRAAVRIAAPMRQPYIMWGLACGQALWATCQGRFDDGERLAQEALRAGLRAQNQNALQAFGVHFALIRRDQGRFQDLEVSFRGFVAEFPLMASWRCAVALLCAETGREAEARREFEHLAADGFATIPKDAWWIAVMVLVAEVCAILRDADRASRLYALLLPYAERYSLAGGPQSGCFGSVARSLGLMATVMRRWEDAARHFDAALVMNSRLRARPQLAHTQLQYAQMLLERGGPGDRAAALALLAPALDTAQEVGMKTLLERALALKLEAQGVKSTDTLKSIDAVVGAVQIERPDLGSHAAPDGTITIMFSDIEGSTAMVERLGDHRWMELLRLHNGIIRREAAVRHGYEVKSQGDGFMVVFPSARRAVLCAIRVQRAFAEHNATHPDAAIRVRMGLHTGEPIQDADDFFGRDVNLAARLTGAANGGEVLVSSVVKQLTEGAGDIRFGQGRDVVLKGFSEARRVFAVDWTDGVSAGS